MALAAAAESRKLRQELQAVVDEYETLFAAHDTLSKQHSTLRQCYSEAATAYKAGLEALWRLLLQQAPSGAVDDARPVAARVIAAHDSCHRALTAAGLGDLAGGVGALALHVAPPSASASSAAEGGAAAAFTPGLVTPVPIRSPRPAAAVAAHQQRAASNQSFEAQFERLESTPRSERRPPHIQQQQATTPQRSQQQPHQYNHHPGSDDSGYAEREADTALELVATRQELEQARAAEARLRAQLAERDAALTAAAAAAAVARAAAPARDAAPPAALQAQLDDAQRKLAALASTNTQLSRAQATLTHEVSLLQERYTAQAGLVAALRDSTGQLTQSLAASESSRLELTRQAAAAVRAAEARADAAERRVSALTSEVDALTERLQQQRHLHAGLPAPGAFSGGGVVQVSPHTVGGGGGDSSGAAMRSPSPRLSPRGGSGGGGRLLPPGVVIVSASAAAANDTSGMLPRFGSGSSSARRSAEPPSPASARRASPAAYAPGVGAPVSPPPAAIDPLLRPRSQRRPFPQGAADYGAQQPQPSAVKRAVSPRRSQVYWDAGGGR